MSRTLLTVGNLVNADSTLLTTLVSIDPIYAYFNVEEPTLLHILKLRREGVLKQRLGKLEVHMGLADDVAHKFPLTGVLDFANNTVDPQTGTILVRGTFANPYHLPDKPPALVPGLFVRVRLDMGVPHKALLVTERAIGTDQGQKYVYVLDEHNKVVYRRVKLGLMFDGLQAIEEGLVAKDRVVVNGLQRIRPGMEVKPDQVDMSSQAKL
jgi:RND family efflux transporter MFP subunit